MRFRTTSFTPALPAADLPNRVTAIPPGGAFATPQTWRVAVANSRTIWPGLVLLGGLVAQTGKPAIPKESMNPVHFLFPKESTLGRLKMCLFFGSWFYQIAKKILANKNDTSPIKSRPCKQSRLRKHIPTSTTCSLVTHSAAMASICPQGFVETGRTPRVKSNLSKFSFQTSSTSSISFMYIYIYTVCIIFYSISSDSSVSSKFKIGKRQSP